MPNIYWMIDLSTGLQREWNTVKLSNGETDYRKHDVNLMLIQDDPNRFPLNFGRDETKSDRTLVQDEEEEYRKDSMEDEKPAAEDTTDSPVVPEKPPSVPKHQNYLWDRNGDFLVIRVPFWEGTHDASNPSDLTPIVQFLQNLHAQGLVHGDIRCFNIVFNGGEGKLIDFDFGGSIGRRRYPRGYVADLADGRRFGSRLEHIKLYDEWYALSFCMLFCHMFRTRNSDANTRIRDIQDEFQTFTADGLPEYVATISDFLGETSSVEWQCTLDPRFRRVIEELRAGRGNPATGSPPDIKRA
jgi:hypothetical protein